jgi:hypothetical protein
MSSRTLENPFVPLGKYCETQWYNIDGTLGTLGRAICTYVLHIITLNEYGTGFNLVPSKDKDRNKGGTYQIFFLILAEQVPVVTTSVEDPNPHHFGKLDPNRDLHQSEKHDPDAHQSEKVEAFNRGSL